MNLAGVLIATAPWIGARGLARPDDRSFDDPEGAGPVPFGHDMCFADHPGTTELQSRWPRLRRSGTHLSRDEHTGLELPGFRISSASGVKACSCGKRNPQKT